MNRIAIKNLTALLVEYTKAIHVAQTYHWNVKGMDFIELHELFEDVYETLREEQDEIAERIVLFGGSPSFLNFGSDITDIDYWVEGVDEAREMVVGMRDLNVHLMNELSNYATIESDGSTPTQEDFYVELLRSREDLQFTLQALADE